MPSIELPAFLQNASFSRRLGYAFGAVILVAGLSFPVTFQALWSMRSGAGDVGRASAVLGGAVAVQREVGDMRSAASRFAASGSRADREQLAKERFSVLGETRKVAALEGLTPEEQEGWENVGAAAAAPVDQLIADRRSSGTATQALKKFERSVDARIQEPVANLTHTAQTRVDEKSSSMTGKVAFSMLLALGVLAFAGGVGAFLAYRIPRQLLGQLRDLRLFAHRLASGDLSARADWDASAATEEIADLVIDLNTMAKALETRDAENNTLQLRLEAALTNEQERATRDPLTSLRNHSFFQDSLRSEIDRCSRMGGEVTIAMIDLDNFKQVNDRFGHHEGDDVLKRATQAITANLRPYDLACRLGGEEFGIIFPQTDAEQAHIVLARIAAAVESCGPNGERCTFSGGIATFPEHSLTQVDLFLKADEAAYTAKARGKAQTITWSPHDVVAMDSDERDRQRSRDAVLTTARTLVAAVDQKDPYTRNHSELTAIYAATLARALGLAEEDVKHVHQAGQLHDVGKIGISDAILTKAGRLTPEEYEQIKQHPEFSYRILQNADIEPIATWVRHHHEHWNGSGYPFGLAGDDIPLGSRIILVADAFEAMTSDRVYRRALTVAQAVQELRDYSSVQFDPRIVEVMVQLISQGVFDDIRARYGHAPAATVDVLQAAPNLSPEPMAPELQPAAQQPQIEQAPAADAAPPAFAPPPPVMPPPAVQPPPGVQPYPGSDQQAA